MLYVTKPNKKEAEEMELRTRVKETIRRDYTKKKKKFAASIKHIASYWGLNLISPSEIKFSCLRVCKPLNNKKKKKAGLLKFKATYDIMKER